MEPLIRDISKQLGNLGSKLAINPREQLLCSNVQGCGVQVQVRPGVRRGLNVYYCLFFQKEVLL